MLVRPLFSAVALSSLAVSGIPYYDIGRQSTTIGGAFTNFAPVTGGFSTASVREKGHIVRAGLNYRFGSEPAAPVVARY
jgi:hypothetical protein